MGGVSCIWHSVGNDGSLPSHIAQPNYLVDTTLRRYLDLHDERLQAPTRGMLLHIRSLDWGMQDDA